MALDDASSYRVVMPTEGVANLGSSGARIAFGQGWLSWAGPPDQLHYDLSKGHIGEQFAELGELNATIMSPVPAEAFWLKGRIERAIDLWTPA